MARITPRKSHLKEGTEILVRSAEQSDAPKLLEALISGLHDGDGMVMDPDEFNQTEEQEENWIATFNENPRELLLVAEAHGQLVGSIGFHVGKRHRSARSG